MSLIDKTYFIGEVSLPKSDFDAIETYISRFEPEVLTSLLGYELYSKLSVVSLVEPYKSLIEGAEYSVEYNGRTTLVKWNGLKNDNKKSLIAYYVYVYYLRKIISSVQSVGTVKAKQENSSLANPFGKILAAWVSFESLYGSVLDSILIPSAYNYLNAHKTNFPEWIFTELNGSMNSHDL